MAMTDDFIHLGDIISTHGLRGTLVIYSFTRPGVAIAEYRRLAVGLKSDKVTEYDVVRCWQHGKRMLLVLDGVSSIEQATALVGQKLFTSLESVELDEGEFLWRDLVGCQVWADDDVYVGEVFALQDFGAQDNLLIQGERQGQQGEWMIPFVDAVVREVDVSGKRIDVVLPEGMDACFTPRF